jgi:amidase
VYTVATASVSSYEGRGYEQQRHSTICCDIVHVGNRDWCVLARSHRRLAANSRKPDRAFHVLEATIEDIHRAYRDGRLTAHQLVQLYLSRIEAYDKAGPNINAIITVNPKALEEADRLDAALKSSGFVGPLHGVPIILKDQMDAVGMPTTLGSVLFKDYLPDRDAFVTQKLKNAGAIVVAKATLGELGGGDTHGSLFGSTRNPYALDRTVGGSSGGSGASVAANLATVAVGQEGFASIRRPAAWNSVVGMRPTAGLVSRGGVYDGWPQISGSLGPMARSVADLARLLDVMVGYDPEDPLTAFGVGHVPASYTTMLDRNGLKGARIGILRESIGYESEPGSADFAKVTAVFERAVGELKAAGASVIDPIVIPKLRELLAERAANPAEIEASFQAFVARSGSPPFKSRAEMMRSADFAKVFRAAQNRLRTSSVGLTREPDTSSHYRYVVARDELMTNVLKVMADNQLNAIVYKAVEHQPTMIKDGINPPFVNQKGVPSLNTFLVFVPAIVVPAGFTSDNLPAGITFMGRPYDDGTLITLAYAYEQATHHRRPPSATPRLPKEP